MGTVISFAERRQERDVKKKEETLRGYITWLHCPTCKTLEYTELYMAGGRIHKCGTMVEEKGVEIDVRAEYTICRRNLDTLSSFLEKSDKLKKKNSVKIVNKLFGSAIQIIRQMEVSEKEYMKRLELIASTSIETYPDQWTPQDHNLEVKKIEPFGVLLTPARQSDLYFPKR
ncbi:hypothetical protein WDW89_22720 [Deltaproteobacteria bacterium TL4]